jgi:hypothetical protein
MENVEKEIKSHLSRKFHEEEKEAVAKKCESYSVVDLRYINGLLIKGYCVWVEPVSPRKETREI